MRFCQNSPHEEVGSDSNLTWCPRLCCRKGGQEDPRTGRTVGKLTLQKIERNHLTLRTRLKRLARKTLCVSRSCLMHDLLSGSYMNRVEFGRAV